MRVLAVFTVVCLLLVGLAEAKVYTLQECIELARKTDPNLARFRATVKAANEAVWVQAGQFLPSLSTSGSYGRNDIGPTSPQFRNLGGGVVVPTESEPGRTIKSYSADISTDYQLFNGLRDVWGYLGSRASKSAAEYNYITAVSDLVYAVKGEYYVALKAKRDLDVAQEAVKRSEELLKLFEEKYTLGSASLSEVLKQKVQFGTDRLTQVQMDNALKIALDELALTVGVQPGGDFDIAEMELRQEPVGELADYLGKGSASNPALLSAKANLNSYRYDVRSAWGQFLPTVSLSYSYGWSKSTFKEIKKFGPEDHSGGLFIRVGFNIFDRFARKAVLNNAKASYNTAAAEELRARNQVVKDIRDSYLGIKLAEEAMKLSTETEAAAKEDMDLVQAKYNLGAAALWELLDAQVSLKRAQFDRVTAEFDYNLAQAKLQNAMGE